jgi:WD40 repeat protein
MPSFRLRLLALAALALLAPRAPGAPSADKPEKGGVRKDLFGDPLPAGAVARLGSVRLRHENNIQSLAFSPDGKQLITGSYTRTLCFWDAASGKELRRLTIGSTGITSAQFSGDGKALAVGSNDGSVRILDPVSGAERKTLRDPFAAYGTTQVALSRDGKTLLATTQHSRNLLLWDVESGRLRQRYGLPNYNSNQPPMAFTPDGKQFLAPSADNRLHVFDAASGKALRALEGPEADRPELLKRRTFSLAVAPDGKTVALSSTSQRDLVVLDFATGKVARRLGDADHPRLAGRYGVARSLAFTPDSRFLVAGGDGQLTVWGVASGKVLRQFEVPASYPPTLAVSRDGRQAATFNGNAIYLYDIRAGKALHAGEGHQTGVNRVVFSADGTRLFSAGGNSLRAWDAASGKPVDQLRPGGTYNLAHLRATPGGKGVRWVSYDRALLEWRPGVDREARRLTAPVPVTNFSLNQSLVSPDGKLLAGVDSNDSKLRLYDLTSAKPPRELTVLPNPWSNVLSFSPDGRRLAVLTQEDRTVRIYDVASATEVRMLAPEAGSPSFYGAWAQFSADGRSLLKFDGELRCYELANGGERFRLPRDGVYSQQAAWSADGRLLARAAGGSTVSVHDTWTGREVLRRDTQQGQVTALALGPGGRFLATGGANTTVLVWELPALPRPAAGPLDKDALWRDLEDGNAAKGFKAMTTLLQSPDGGVGLIQERFKARPAADPKLLARLLVGLGNDAYEVREKAEEGLAALGVSAEDILFRGAKSRSPEVRRRCENLLRRLNAGGLAPERLRLVRAIEVLEQSSNPAARDLLRRLAKGKFDRLVDLELKYALERLAGGTDEG